MTARGHSENAVNAASSRLGSSDQNIKSFFDVNERDTIYQNTAIMGAEGSGCGTVGTEIASDTRGPGFKYLFTLVCQERGWKYPIKNTYRLIISLLCSKFCS